MQQTRLGVSSHLHFRPLVQPLADNPLFHVVTDTPVANAMKLRNMGLSAVLMPPIDYAREASQFAIIPRVGVSSYVPNGAISLHFREALHTVTTVAVDPTSTAEIVLTKIMLAEEFDIAPTLVPVVGSPEQMLEKADAALLVGDAALRYGTKHQNSLDLVEAWNEMTRLPYVHALWCGRTEELTPPNVRKIQETRTQTNAVVTQIVNEASFASASVIREYLEGFSYELTEMEERGIVELFHYAYYHGVLLDIPELHFYSQDADRDNFVRGVLDPL